MPTFPKVRISRVAILPSIVALIGCGWIVWAWVWWGASSTGRSLASICLVALLGAFGCLGIALVVSPAWMRRVVAIRASALMSSIGIALMVVYPIFDGPGTWEVHSPCMSSGKALSLNMLMYSMDHDEHLPPSSSWRSVLRFKPNDPLGKSLRCPDARSEWNYGMNLHLGGLSEHAYDHPAQTVLLFETESDNPDVSGGSRLISRRHDGGSNFAFADGHMKFSKQDEEYKFRWRPTPEKPHDQDH
jgi:prepilin-type processing-associated H-X9-DG protein